MRDLLLTAFVFSMLPVAVLSPHVGVYLWYWLGYMNPHRLMWGFAWSMPFAQLTAAATLLGLLFTREERRIPWSRTTVLWLFFTAWASFTTLFALNQDPAQEQWLRFIKIQLMTLVAIVLINSKNRIVTLVWVVVLSIGFYGVKGGVFTVLSGGDFRVWGPAKTMIEGNNELAFALIVILPLMRYLQLISERTWVRWGLTVAMVLCAFSIMGSHSRGALLAGGAMVATLILKSRRKFVLGLGALVMVGTLFQFAPERWVSRMQTIQTYQADGSAMGRINAWHFAFNLAKDRPILGGGFDVFSKEIFLEYAPNPLDFHDSHSIYFGVMAEHGFVGLALFLGMGFSTMLTAGRIARETKKEDDLLWVHDLASMVQVSIVGYAVGGVFLGLGYFDLLYNLVGFVIILQALVLREKARTADEVTVEPSGSTLPSGSVPATRLGAARSGRRHSTPMRTRQT